MTSTNDELVPITPPSQALTQPQLAQAGAAANRAAAAYIFADYRQRRAPQTIKTQTAALLLWVNYLMEVGAAGELLVAAAPWAKTAFPQQRRVALVAYAKTQGVPLPVVHAAHYCQHVPAAWQGVSWGLVEGFVKWLLARGYTIASVNNRLSAVKVYARLAAQAGVIPPTEQALIREVRGYGVTEGKRVDTQRSAGHSATRLGHKKGDVIVLTAAQAAQLKSKHPPTPQGIRDRLLFCLLLDLGLRAGEVAALQVDDIAEPGYVIVYRQKTDTTDRMAWTADIRQALVDYAPFLRESGLLLRGSRKNGRLTDQTLSVRAVGARVKLLGRDILNIWELSPHDLRHTWATHAAQLSSPFALRDAGGWSNMQTPSRYVDRAQVVNEEIQLDY